MTLRHMNIFCTICENGFNTTRAAEVLHMTQPAVSLAIKEVEQYYGIKLFDRLGRRLQITEAGQHFLQYAIHICALFRDMEMGLRNWDYQGLIRVGASITIGSQFMPGYVKAFTQRYPEAEVRVVVEQSDRLERKLLAGELDLALIEGIAHSPVLISEAYMEDHLSIVCPSGGRWKQGQRVSVEELLQQKFLLREPGSGTREVFDRVMANAGYSVTPAWEAMSTTALTNAVINGLGIAVLPHRMIIAPLERGSVITVMADGLEFNRSFYIVYHKDKYLTTSARKFIELCRDYEMDYPLPRYHSL